MARNYKCTRCNRDAARSSLRVKKVVFLEMGAGARTIRSRVTEWLCAACVVADPDWKLPSQVDRERTPLREVSSAATG